MIYLHSGNKCEALSDFQKRIGPFAMKLQDQLHQMKKYEWKIEKLDASGFIDDLYLKKAKNERNWIFKKDIMTYFIDSVKNWNEK